MIEPGVHPVRVGPGQGSFLRRQMPCDELPGPRSESMDSVVAVGGQQAGPQELGELAGCTATHQVHLKETVLGVNESQRPGNVSPAPSHHGRHAKSIALDRNPPGESLEIDLSFQLGQAGRQAVVDPHRCQAQQEHKCQAEGDQDSEECCFLGR